MMVLDDGKKKPTDLPKAKQGKAPLPITSNQKKKADDSTFMTNISSVQEDTLGLDFLSENPDPRQSVRLQKVLASKTAIETEASEY